MMAKWYTGQIWPKFPDIRLTVEGKSQKNLNQETDSTRNQTQAHWMSGNDDTSQLQQWSQKVMPVGIYIPDKATHAGKVWSEGASKEAVWLTWEP